MKTDTLIAGLEKLIFSNRPLILAFFVLMTLYMGFSLTHLKIDAGFSKQLPLNHEYMRTYVEHRSEFGGANRVLIALMTKEGDIFTPEFFKTLEQATDDVFFIPGVDRSQTASGAVGRW